MKTASLVVFEGIRELSSWVSEQRFTGQTIGFVPTMGALHSGHISLLSKAKSECDKVVVSIFVNPTQFNNRQDLEKYPRTRESDINLLNEEGCDVLFHPEVIEMYPEERKGHWDFGSLSQNLEGHFRPGHFDGVLTIVKRLFEVVSPDVAYFGEKDYQQLALIRRMTLFEGLPVKIVGCPSVRETDGLAMSSRNLRLNETQRMQSVAISKTLFGIQERANELSPMELKEWATRRLSDSPGIRLEYLELADPDTLEPVDFWQDRKEVIALVAAYVGDIRLIDNVHVRIG